jgi:pyruvate formate lyase activating enzyme
MWCANPESQMMKRELFIRKSNCIRCNKCVQVCPENCIEVIETGVNIIRSKCSGCNRCVNVCKSNAITLIGEYMTVEEVCTEVLRDRVFYESSGGGVTFSGGEPYEQVEFLVESLKKCKEYDIHTVVETSGYIDQSMIIETMDYIDIFYIDLKIMDNKKHQTYTGVSNHKILNTIKFTASQGKKLIVRIPIIPGVNDDYLNIMESGKYLESVGVSNVQLLPYHSFGKSKYTSLGRKYALDIESPTQDDMDKIKYQLNKFKFAVLD